MGQLIRTSDGRDLAVEHHGNPRGRPVFLLHGTPGSRLGQAPRSIVLYQLGVNLITFDRPGYGKSDRLPGRRVASAAADVEAIADALDIGEFAVVGRSGGAPHALACAALLPERAVRTAALVGLAPRNAQGLDWFAGMTEANVREYNNAAAGGQQLTAALEFRSVAIRSDPRGSVDDLRRGLSASDRGIVADVGIQAMLVRNFTEALRSSADGWVDDVMAFSTDWGFRPEDIAANVLLWHGEDDVFAPVQHTRWLAERIPGAHLEVESGAAHFGALRVLTRILSWAIS
ncbi:alpha/beta hydrolase [Streptomyces lunaelactis]|uniref:Alpha/beta hydrolase n=1 Tax=Streptomyces lunaelactis TaxID=1535768 RepID=A0A2R4SY39_9ACTN|nr:alpha/beta hydrolase [Streptomyces lunaelactis]AVZ71782.1 alpha/beta hydrolase [Streptomyces lunaelactis]NUK85827.1 alpha/beta hydrolase [Streptomyces lunaelactis]NUL06137.1 alpha/beta hydrolase [Streptomyces lunaelactis]